MVNNTNSTIVAALEKAWFQIRKVHTEVPYVIMVVASGTTGRRLKWGHFAESRWGQKADETRGLSTSKVSEVLISGEGFQRAGKDVLGTLLHEAAHGLATARKLKDTSRAGRYHNKVFKALAQELGLEVEKQGSYGLARTSVPAETEKKWQSTIKALDQVIQTFRFAEGQSKKKPGSRMLLAVCACETKIRLSKQAYEAAAIICTACDQEFEQQT